MSGSSPMRMSCDDLKSMPGNNKGTLSESYFGRSWSHSFFNWKRFRIMMGATARDTLRRLKLKSPRVLELGCGSGTGIFETADVCQEISGVRWYGLDLNIRAVAAASSRSNLRESRSNKKAVCFLTADLSALPFPDRCFDLLLCTEVLEHIADPKVVIAEMARITTRGGYVLITTPNPNNIVEKLGYVIDRISKGSLKRAYWSGHDSLSAPPLSAEAGLAHVSVHPYRTWRRLLEDAGLRVVRKIRGSALFGGPFFDRHPIITGTLIALDPILDKLPCRYLLSNNLGILCCRERPHEI